MEPTPASFLGRLLKRSGASAREVDRLAGRKEGQLAIIISRNQASLRGDIAAAYAVVFGCTKADVLAADGDLPGDAHILASVNAARQRRNPGALGHTCNDFTPAPNLPVDESDLDDDPTGPVLVVDEFSQVG